MKKQAFKIVGLKGSMQKDYVKFPRTQKLCLNENICVHEFFFAGQYKVKGRGYEVKGAWCRLGGISIL